MKAGAKAVNPPTSDQAFLTAAVVALAAAVFTVAIWAPMQMRAFSRAVEATHPADFGATAAQGWMNVPFVTADGATMSLASSNGRVRVVTMMYTHCPGICPLAISTLRRMETHMTAAQRSQVSIIALSLDPEHDPIARLQQYRQDADLDPERFIVGRPSLDGLRQMASALGVSYHALSDGSIDHQSIFVLLDKSGRVVARSTDTAGLDSKFFSALQAAATAR